MIEDDKEIDRIYGVEASGWHLVLRGLIGPELYDRDCEPGRRPIPRIELHGTQCGEGVFGEDFTQVPPPAIGR